MTIGELREILDEFDRDGHQLDEATPVFFLKKGGARVGVLEHWRGDAGALFFTLDLE